ncbi:hypothetical protein SAMN04489835_3006 [Mycolicibacterium rutilum]|uniref:Secreted protein n=1 Tax=Mycolicibacterium rutilum TaxID=370526 RepID=A0A1H6K993_MYCRU|nr:hypothetical protein [Mycolicibacterium rutilum]SEH69908.1 hypothetical protein SAMN04489835_3006 [Mycolicibacterium rutilum]
MNTGSRITAFVAALAAVFAVSVWVGRAFGPDGDAAGHSTAAHDASAAEQPGGLQVTEDGYTLDLAQPLQRARDNAPFRFRILGADGAPVTRFAETHEKLLHLIVVSNDLAVFQHLHPVLDEQGTWRVPVDFRRAGDYRVYADFVPAGGPAVTLGANVHVAGDYRPQPLPAPAVVSEVDDYSVTLSGTAPAGTASTLTLSVERDGAPVEDLQPYLGAYGHLVAIRAADLGYLHVHPMAERSGPAIQFRTAFPSAGDYRLFLDFQHRDTVRTAAFTVTVPGSAAPDQDGPTQDAHGDGHGH